MKTQCRQAWSRELDMMASQEQHIGIGSCVKDQQTFPAASMIFSIPQASIIFFFLGFVSSARSILRSAFASRPGMSLSDLDER